MYKNPFVCNVNPAVGKLVFADRPTLPENVALPPSANVRSVSPDVCGASAELTLFLKIIEPTDDVVARYVWLLSKPTFPLLPDTVSYTHLTLPTT